ncbi:MAG: 4Fe-4S dicluster domain-containing protein, partial [Deltaproteobacteria bacterium]|nr:4Fe-4S dicluster domain-containing protein [Deltaproteobacteria bacterium]
RSEPVAAHIEAIEAVIAEKKSKRQTTTQEQGEDERVSRRRLAVIEERCVGCRICELSCSMSHRQGVFNPRYGLIGVESHCDTGLNKPISRMDYPHICRQCDPAPCAEACPADAFDTDEALSIRVINQDACSGCEQCLAECPHGRVLMNRETEKAMKCDLCGGDPLCVRYCPVPGTGEHGAAGCDVDGLLPGAGLEPSDGRPRK